MKTARMTIRFVLTWPLFVGWLFPLLAIAVFMARKLKMEGEGVLSAVWRPWTTKIWKYNTTLARGMVFQQGDRDEPRIISHEFVHIRQYEDCCLLALTIGIVVAVTTWDLAWLALWVTGPLWLLPNFLGALLRGGDVYRDSEHERSAYAQTDTWLSNTNESWLDAHEKV